MELLSFKALHIIGFVAWFAGLFYLPRIFVYHIEILARKNSSESDQAMATQYTLMEERLFKIIMRPAMVITFVGGIGMLIINPDYLTQGWLQAKLILILLLAGYNDYLPKIIRKLKDGKIPMTSERMRLFNEVPTLILVTISLLAVFRGALPWWQIVLIVIGLVIFIVGASKLYRRVRARNNS